VNVRAGFFFLPLLLTSCGYIGETQPPSLKVPVPVTDLAAVERGSKIVAQFTVPTSTTDSLRLVEKPHLVLYVDDKSFDVPSDRALAQREVDATPFYGKDVKVTVKAFNKNRRDAGFSNSVDLHVVPALALPANLQAVGVPEGIRVSWESPETSFTIFRQGPGDSSLTKLDTVSGSPYIDKGTEYGKEYRYAVQATSKSAESEVAEMAKAYTPVDTFPPATPKALAAVVGTQSVELVWDLSIESDFAGYRVYRDVGSGQFERIGESHDTPGFSDKTVEHGKRYRYAVTAYDKSGNESSLSEPVEVFIP
jgi:hypothetical protein